MNENGPFIAHGGAGAGEIHANGLRNGWDGNPATRGMGFGGMQGGFLSQIGVPLTRQISGPVVGSQFLNPSSGPLVGQTGGPITGQFNGAVFGQEFLNPVSGPVVGQTGGPITGQMNPPVVDPQVFNPGSGRMFGQVGGGITGQFTRPVVSPQFLDPISGVRVSVGQDSFVPLSSIHRYGDILGGYGRRIHPTYPVLPNQDIVRPASGHTQVVPLPVGRRSSIGKLFFLTIYELSIKLQNFC